LGTAERIWTKFTQKMCLVPHSDEFKGEIKGQCHQEQKMTFFGPFSRLRAVYVL